MADTPNEAAAPAPVTGETVATPTNTNIEPVAAPAPSNVDLHGFTQEDLAGMRTFIDNNGGWDKIKSRISNPQTASSQVPEVQPISEPTPQPQAAEPGYRAPAGAITAQEFLAQQYFQSLSKEEKYAPISKGIESGEYLKEMSAFGINALNQDGSINDQKVRMYLDLKAQTVPAQTTSSEPNASTAPTVDYVATGADGAITSAEQAYAVIRQDAQLKSSGMAGHPSAELAEKFISEMINGKKPAEKKK